MGDDLPTQGGGLPTLGDYLANWLGFQLPSVPLPQTVKNLDRAVGKILLAAGENAEARIKANTGKQKAKGKIEVEGMYRTEEERRKLENRAATVKVAVDELNERQAQTDATQEIDDDWLNLYAKLAEDKSSEELRSLFGKILAGEIRKPGSFSLRTMQFLSALSRDEAHRISEFFAFVLSDELVPTPHDLNNEKLPGFRVRKLMEELGIASTSNPIGGLQINPQVLPHDTLCLIASGYAILIRNNSDETLKFTLACQFLTSLGRELYSIANPPKTPTEYLRETAQLVAKSIHRTRAGAGTVTVVIAIPAVDGIRAGNTIYAADVNS